METAPNWFDDVIPHYLDLDDFPLQETKGDYLLFVGRLCREKGPDIAIDIANRAGMKIIVAGVNQTSHDVPAWIPRRLCGIRGLRRFQATVGIDAKCQGIFTSLPVPGTLWNDADRGVGLWHAGDRQQLGRCPKSSKMGGRVIFAVIWKNSSTR